MNRLFFAGCVVAALISFVYAGQPTLSLPEQNQPWKRHVIDASSLGADGVRASDVNRDSLPDLVVGWEQGGITRLYLSSADSAKATWRTVTVGAAPDVEDAVFFDADADGVSDVVSCTEGDTRKVLVHWAPRDPGHLATEGEWKTDTLYSNGSQWMFAVPMDVDRRHGRDLVLGGKDQGASVGWLQAPRNPRSVRDWKYYSLSPAGWSMSLIVEDMDRDGDLDVLLSDRYGEMAGVRWLENPGSNAPSLTGTWKNHWVGLRGRAVMFIDMHDFDGDGRKEIVAPHFLEEDFRLSILKLTADGKWDEHDLRYPAMAGRPKSVAIGDIDRDGRPDIVLASEGAGGKKRGIVWLRYRETPFQPEWDSFDVSGPEGVKFDLNLLLDVDRDGDLDVINTEENNNAAGGIGGLGLVWYENAVKPRQGFSDQR